MPRSSLLRKSAPSEESLKNLVGRIGIEQACFPAVEKPLVSSTEQRKVTKCQRIFSARNLAGCITTHLGVKSGSGSFKHLPEDVQNRTGADVGEKEMIQSGESPWALVPEHRIGISGHRLELLRLKKIKGPSTDPNIERFKLLAQRCGGAFGPDTTMNVLGLLGRGVGTLAECHALVGVLVQEARDTADEEALLEKTYQVFQLFKLMKAKGFGLHEDIFGPFLKFLIDMGMVEEFRFFSAIIKDDNRDYAPCLGYYDMLLWVQVNDTEKIQELCDTILINDVEGLSSTEVYRLTALLECGQKKELLPLLEVVDVTKVGSVNILIDIFKSLGRLSVEPIVDEFITACKSSEYALENLSQFICYYAINLPDIVSKEVVSKFKYLHQKHKVQPASTSYEKIIIHCCDNLKVYTALAIVKEMCDEGMTVSLETMHSIIHACEASVEYQLVEQLYSIIRENNLKVNSETFKRMISLRAKMNNFGGAYEMINDAKDAGEIVTCSMYNSIMAGYLRENNISGALMVVQQMEKSGLKPDSHTYCMLIESSESEDTMLKYYDKMKEDQLQLTRSVYTAVINSYAARGQFEKAKEVVQEKGIPDKHEVKSALAFALAANGRVSDALEIYEEVKQARGSLEPKAILCIIDNCQSRGEEARLIQLLEGLEGSEYWCDGCSKIACYCIKHEDVSTAIKLIKKLQLEFFDELTTESLCEQIFCQIAWGEPVKIEVGFEFLEAMKKDIGLQPTRKCLEFLLSACTNAKDLRKSLLVWKEYERNGYTYSVLCYLRMYKALLACGDLIHAQKILKQMPQEDFHIRHMVEAYQMTYLGTSTNRYTRKPKRMLSPSKTLLPSER